MPQVPFHHKLFLTLVFLVGFFGSFLLFYHDALFEAPPEPTPAPAPLPPKPVVAPKPAPAVISIRIHKKGDKGL